MCIRDRKMGLTVKGKIDLKPIQDKQKADAARKKEGASADGDDDKPKHKKKKKKIVRPETPGKVEEQTEAEKKKAASKKPIGKKGKAREVDAAEVKDAIKRTIAAMGDYGPVSARSSLCFVRVEMYGPAIFA